MLTMSFLCMGVLTCMVMVFSACSVFPFTSHRVLTFGSCNLSNTVYNRLSMLPVLQAMAVFDYCYTTARQIYRRQC